MAINIKSIGRLIGYLLMSAIVVFLFKQLLTSTTHHSSLTKARRIAIEQTTTGHTTLYLGIPESSSQYQFADDGMMIPTGMDIEGRIYGSDKLKDFSKGLSTTYQRWTISAGEAYMDAQSGRTKFGIVLAKDIDTGTLIPASKYLSGDKRGWITNGIIHSCRVYPVPATPIYLIR